MPEAPVIIQLCEQLQPFIAKHVITARGKATKYSPDRLAGQKLVDVRTYGKELLMCFEDFTLRIHLMLFGSFTVNSHKDIEPTVGIEFANGEVNFYASNTYLIEEPLDEVYDFRTELMNEKFDKKLALERLEKEGDELICDAVLDQHIFAGLGNKIKDECLYHAGVHPLSRVHAVPTKKKKEIIDQAVKTGFQILDWRRNGGEDHRLVVHYRELCPKHHIPLTKQKIGKTKRTSYYCEKCQKLYS
jgi:endonuclease-8